MNERKPPQLSQSVAGKVRLGWFWMDGVEPSREPDAFETDLEALCTHLRAEYHNPASAGPRHRLARVLYRSFGIDPTRHRPSSEALLRRVLTGKPLYRINAVVDGANLCSLETALPVGLYDVGMIEGPVTVGQGREGEGYEGIGKGRVNLEGKLALRDDQGPFGNPSSDSFRTRIREETRSILFIFFAPLDASLPEMDRMISRAAERMKVYTGGVVKVQGVLPVRD